MNGAGLEMLYDPLDLYVWVFFLRILFHFELFNVIFYWCDLFFALPRVFWKENSCHFCVYVALNYWIHCFTIARLELTLLLLTRITISFCSFSLEKSKNSKSGLSWLLFFHKTKSSQKCNRKPSPIKELVWRCLCFLSWKPKSCLHPMVHIVLVTQCFSFLSFWNHKFIDGLCSRLP